MEVIKWSDREAIAIARDSLLRGDINRVADMAGCSRQVVNNALKKESVFAMTNKEKEVFDNILYLLKERKKQYNRITNKAENILHG